MRFAFTSFLFSFFFCICVDIIAQSNERFPSIGSSYKIINNITVSGNGKTKEKIILRELTFKKGDTISVEKIESRILRSKQNLLNTSLFNFITIDTIPFFGNIIDIHIDVAERWYIFPIPIFEIAERNFNTWWQTKNLERASYGMYLTDENFRGLKESLTLKLRLGYSEQYGMSYNIPYIDKRQRSGMSFAASYSRTHEIPYKTYANQLLFYKNINYYVRQEISARTSYSYRQGLYNTHYGELKYVKGILADTILKLTNDYFPTGQNTLELFILGYSFRHDYRDSKVYPLRGYYWGFDITKTGLGILKDGKIDLLQLQGTIRKYMKLDTRLYFGSSFKFKLSTLQKQPYYVQRALGYGDYVRGYEYYVIDGQSYALLKTNVHYQIIKPHVKKISFLNADKFDTFHYALYFSMFTDAAYVKDNYYFENNPLTNDWIVGYGLGLDFVTYYDTVIRFEYARNRLDQNIFSIRLSAPL